LALRARIKAGLEAVGLLDVARQARDAIVSASWWRRNRPIRRTGAADRLPLPPLRLIRAATGTSSLSWLLEGGALAADSIGAILAANGTPITEARNILDFGCGCGRVIRHWARLPAAVHGCDYNAAAVRWCQRHLPFARFTVNGLAPPLPYASGQFDLVYALSVFTHLPEPLMLAWMQEMARVLAPGGFLIVSTHGEACLDGLTPEQRAAFRAGRAVVRDEPSAGTNRCGVYVSEEYVRRRMASGFLVLAVVPQGARGNPPQDLILLQKKIATGG
jgi:SAM-dependent methyltransferase